MTNGSDDDKSAESPSFKEGVDYYVDENGLYIMTKAYLLRRGFCCHQGCRHCPYGDPSDNK